MIPLPDNPILQRELHRRLGGPGFLMGWVLGYSLFLSLLVGAASLGLFLFRQHIQQMPVPTEQVGRILHAVLFSIQGWFFFFTVPALAAAAITSEKEKKTLHMTIITCMTPVDILLGKIAGIFLFSGVLILSSVPITMLTFQFGNVSWWDFLGGYLTLFMAVLYYVGCGIGASGLCEKTATATALTYALIAMMYFGTGVVPPFMAMLYNINQNQSLNFWIKVYPWMILTVKVGIGVGLLWFGFTRLKNFELIG